MGGGRLTTLIILVTFSHGPASLKPTLVSRRCLCRNLQNNPELKQHVASGVVSSASGFPGFPSASQWHSTDAACRPFHAAHLAASYSRVIPSNTEASYERNEHWNNVCYSGKRRTIVLFDYRGWRDEFQGGFRHGFVRSLACIFCMHNGDLQCYATVPSLVREPFVRRRQWKSNCLQC